MTPALHTIQASGHKFRVITGELHPGYSVATFDEERDFRDKYWAPKKNDVCIDVGAAYGAYTLPALAAGCQVYAFEPVPSVATDLAFNIAINNWNNSGSVVQLGLWDSREAVEMSDYATHWPRNADGKHALGTDGPLPYDTLDNWAAREELDRLDWLKIDVEGAEERVIRGGAQLIARGKPTLIIECHNFMDPGISARVRAMLPMYEFEEVPREPCVMLVGRAA